MSKRSKNILTNSSMTTYQRCPRAYYYRYVWGLAPKKVSDKITIGKLTHKGLAYLHQGKDLNEAINLVFSETSTDASMAVRKTVATMLTQYALKWKDDADTKQTLAVESVLRRKLDDNWWLAGKLDWVIRDDEGVWVVECKTTSRIDRDYLAKLPLDNQVTTYYYLASGKWKGEMRGVIYDVVVRPRIYRRSGEDIDTYLERAAAAYLANPTAYFTRQCCFREEWKVDSFLSSALYTAKEIEKRLGEDADAWPQFTWSCFLRGRECPYAQLCSYGENLRTLSAFEIVDPMRELLE